MAELDGKEIENVEAKTEQHKNTTEHVEDVTEQDENTTEQYETEQANDTVAEGKDPYLDQLYKDYDYSSTEFDKSLTYISSGILAVSYAFIEKVVKLNKCTFKVLLIQGWYLLSIAIFLSVIAHYSSVWIQKLSIIYYKKEDDQRQKSIRLCGEILILVFNLITMILILIGAINIINFIKINI